MPRRSPQRSEVLYPIFGTAQTAGIYSFPSRTAETNNGAEKHEHWYLAVHHRHRSTAAVTLCRTSVSFTVIFTGTGQNAGLASCGISFSLSITFPDTSIRSYSINLGQTSGGPARKRQSGQRYTYTLTSLLERSVHLTGVGFGTRRRRNVLSQHRLAPNWGFYHLGRSCV